MDDHSPHHSSYRTNSEIKNLKMCPWNFATNAVAMDVYDIKTQSTLRQLRPWKIYQEHAHGVLSSGSWCLDVLVRLRCHKIVYLCWVRKLDPAKPSYEKSITNLRSSPSSSGDLFSSPGWSFSFSFTSLTIPDTGAYWMRIRINVDSTQLNNWRPGNSTISEAAFTLSTAPIWSRVPESTFSGSTYSAK